MQVFAIVGWQPPQVFGSGSERVTSSADDGAAPQPPAPINKNKDR